MTCRLISAAFPFNLSIDRPNPAGHWMGILVSVSIKLASLSTNCVAFSTHRIRPLHFEWTSSQQLNKYLLSFISFSRGNEIIKPKAPQSIVGANFTPLWQMASLKPQHEKLYRISVPLFPSCMAVMMAPLSELWHEGFPCNRPSKGEKVFVLYVQFRRSEMWINMH